ncbi:helix-turn-helix domain-containing protein [Micromonospora sp. RTP1Z1]|uniref:helix-turn-helix domain-containing protein n=1 Tax=Micromonospora sp. RTP1Z1 TaxID=2994043 RepID=UPI0029C655F1|nr:helix-turn-helix domain-containing protein [Micromonospora sp. RTP1Z1]
MTGDVAELIPSTEPIARARAARIREGIHNYLETLAEIALAWERRDWQVLGYADWQAYVDGEFGAERLKLPTEHRQKAVAELRLAGMSQRAIGTALGVDAATVTRDLRGVADATPAEVRGVDGKTYAATRPAPAPAAPAASPEPGEQVWIATAPKGSAAHALKSAAFTRCGRATRTGLTLTARQSVERWEATWCRPCWPDQETTRFAAGDTALAGPADEADDPPASREAGAEIRGSAPAGTTPETAAEACTDPADGAATASPQDAGDVAPAPAPPPASPGGGAGVTPDAEALTVEQVRRLRAVFEWARASLARHPRYAHNGRGKPRALCREYVMGEPRPRAPRGFSATAQDLVAHVEVSWYPDGELELVYRSDRYVMADPSLYVPGVDEGLDMLCALGILPARFSRQYALGVQVGMRIGDAIDGELVATDG